MLNVTVNLEDLSGKEKVCMEDFELLKVLGTGGEWLIVVNSCLLYGFEMYN